MLESFQWLNSPISSCPPSSPPPSLEPGLALLALPVLVAGVGVRVVALELVGARERALGGGGGQLREEK